MGDGSLPIWGPSKEELSRRPLEHREDVLEQHVSAPIGGPRPERRASHALVVHRAVVRGAQPHVQVLVQLQVLVPEQEPPGAAGGAFSLPIKSACGVGVASCGREGSHGAKAIDQRTTMTNPLVAKPKRDSEATLLRIDSAYDNGSH